MHYIEEVVYFLMGASREDVQNLIIWRKDGEIVAFADINSGEVTVEIDGEKSVFSNEFERFRNLGIVKRAV